MQIVPGILQKGSIRQRISFSIFTLDMSISLYMSQGIIYQQHKYLQSLRRVTGLNV